MGGILIELLVRIVVVRLLISHICINKQDSKRGASTKGADWIRLLFQIKLLRDSPRQVGERIIVSYNNS